MKCNTLRTGVNSIHKAKWAHFLPRWALIAIMIWLSLSAIVFFLGQLYIDHVRAATIETAFARANICAEELEQVMLRSTGVVEDIQSLIQIREDLLANGDEAGAAAIAEDLRGTAGLQKSGVLQISTIGSEGRPTWAARLASGADATGAREHVLSGTSGERGLSVSGPLIDAASGRWSLQFTHRLTKPDRSIGDVSLVSLDLLQLSATLANLRASENGVLAIWNLSDGKLVARSRDAEMLFGLPPNPDLKNQPAGGTASGGSRRMLSTVDGHRKLQVDRPIGYLPLLASVSLDVDNELSGTQDIANWVHVAAASFALLVGALTALLIVSAAIRRSALELELVRQGAEMTEMTRTRISQLLSGLPAAVYGINLGPDGGVVDFTITETAQRLTGWDETELASRHSWVSRAFGIDEFDWHSYYRKIIKDGDAAIEYRFLRRDGAMVWLRDQARVVKRGDDGQVSVVGYVSEITRERAIQAQAVASSKLATLGEMATGLAHELNQPIATMSLAAENAAHMLEQKGADGITFALQRMRRIVDQAMRARTIINHLRIFGRQSSEELGSVQLKVVIDGALALVGSALRSAGVIVDIILEDELPPVLAQPILAEHVMVNLLLNARDAMEANPAEQPRDLVISARLDVTSGTVILSVRDTGPGIPPHLIERIFEPFFTTKEAGKGTGLGLSLCHGIMGSFDGDITAKNTLGGGADFVATFRSAPAQTEMARDAGVIPVEAAA
jgi:PAS domain S-box-containing protein